MKTVFNKDQEVYQGHTLNFSSWSIGDSKHTLEGILEKADVNNPNSLFPLRASVNVAITYALEPENKEGIKGLIGYKNFLNESGQYTLLTKTFFVPMGLDDQLQNNLSRLIFEGYITLDSYGEINYIAPSDEQLLKLFTVEA